MDAHQIIACGVVLLLAELVLARLLVRLHNRRARPLPLAAHRTDHRFSPFDRSPHGRVRHTVVLPRLPHLDGAVGGHAPVPGSRDAYPASRYGDGASIC